MMKVLLIPTTEGFGHVSRTLAIIRALEKSGAECHILTDMERAGFLLQNGISQTKIDTSFYGISYVYRRRNGNCNLNMLCTVGKVIAASPFYLKDICSVLYKVLRKERYDLIINDLTLHLSRIPGARVLNIGHYTLFRSLSDIRRMVSDMHCLWYEGIIEPVINLPVTGSHRFWMDLRSGLIDNDLS
ncbi:MAG: hypothetical protein JXA44_01815 [Methanospirillaceae archaeon]|nr:hypothetical protein [Methanospirillaceae archaeon]